MMYPSMSTARVLSESKEELTPLLPLSLKRVTPHYRTFSVNKRTNALPPRRVFRYVALVSVLACCAKLVSFGVEQTSDITIEPFSSSTTSTSVSFEAGKDGGLSTGHAIIGIILLQLSCVLQPAGSAIFEGVVNFWRFSPFYCLVDFVKTLVDIVRLLQFRCQLSTAIHVVCAARYRSRRVFKGETPVEDLVLADVQDVHRITPRRRLLAAVMGIIACLQFVKIMTAQGPLEYAAAGYVLASIFFTYWLLQELMLVVLHFTPKDMDNWDEYELVTLALYLRPEWHRRENPRLQIFFSILLAIGHAVLAVAIGATHLTREGGEGIPAWANGVGDCLLLVLPFVLLVAISHDMDSLVYDWCEPYIPYGAMNWWYLMQAVQVEGFLLLYYVCMYDSSQICRPSWINWLGKI